MELQQLKYFQAAATESSFSAAASKLGIAQATLSRSIARLERELGTVLFDRVGRNRVVLSRGGAILLYRFESAMAILDEGVSAARDSGRADRGRVSFLASSGHLINDFLADYAGRYEQVRIIQSYTSLTNMQNALRLRETDFALTHTPLKSEFFNWRQLFSQELYILVSDRHPLARKGYVRLAELAGERFVSNRYAEDMENILDGLFRRAGFTPDFFFYGDEPEMLRQFIRQGRAVAVIPGYEQARIELGLDSRGDPDPRIHTLRVTEPVCEVGFGVATLKDRFISPVAQNFLDELYDYADRVFPARKAAYDALWEQRRRTMLER